MSKKNHKPSYQELEDEVLRLREEIAAMKKITPPAFSNLSPIACLAMSAHSLLLHIDTLLNVNESDCAPTVELSPELAAYICQLDAVAYNESACIPHPILKLIAQYYPDLALEYGWKDQIGTNKPAIMLMDD